MFRNKGYKSIELVQNANTQEFEMQHAHVIKSRMQYISLQQCKVT
jgi:hypothetical protein